MTTRSLDPRTVRRGIVAAGLLPVLTAGLLVRPAPAQSQEAAFGLYALTFDGAAATTQGEVGAGGGLAVIDSGAPSVVGRLDSSPSGSVKAAPVEPGTLVRTAVNLANNEAGGETVPIPTANAGFPGGNGEDSVDGTGEQAAGPYTTTGYSADATATELAISGSAEATEQRFDDGSSTARSSNSLKQGLRALAVAYPSAGFAIEDDASTYAAEGGRVVASASADPAGGTLTSTVTSTSGATTILGQIEIGSVVGTATVSLEGGQRVAEATTSVGDVTIGGVPVELGSGGVSVAGTELLPGQTFADLNSQLNAVLTNAGVTLEPLEPTEQTGDGFAEADSGGVKVTVATAPNPQVPGNTLTLILGRAATTLSDEPPFAPIDSGPIGGGDTPADTGSTGSGGFSSTPTGGVSSGGDFDSGSVPAGSSSLDAEQPAVAAPSVAEPSTGGIDEPVLVAGRRISKKVALAAFGGWQLLSLSICTLAAFALRRREPEVAW